MQQEQALGIARMLVKAGVPMFLAREDSQSPNGYKLPFGWETNEPDVSVVDAWQPGYALCAVTGRTFDLIDVDTYAGGDERSIPMPKAYLMAETASGGRHYFVKTLGVGSLDGKVAPGIDVKSGTLEGSGRGFAFIAPTVRRSKVDGVPREYRWVVGPEGPVLPTPDQLAADGSGALLAARVLEIRRTAASATPRTVPESVARREWEAAVMRLSDRVAHWRRFGWGGEAHSDLLAITTNLARLSPEHAEAGFFWAFRNAGAEPDHNDLSKLHSALEKAVPDVVIPDNQLSGPEAFFLGGEAPPQPFGTGRSLPAVALNAGLGSGGADTAFSEGRSRFALLDEFEAEAIEPPAPIIEGVLYSGTKARLSAPSGAAKTWLVLDMLAHIANGAQWQGRAVRQCGVVYVAGEGAPSFGPRVKAWREYHGKPSLIKMTADIAQVAQDEWLLFIQAMAEEKPGVIVFDTASTITVGLEENSNKDAAIIHARLNMLVGATGACILLIHHTGWEDKGRPRGASGMYGGMDTELILVRDGKSLNLTLKFEKQKYVPEDPPMRLRMEKAHGGLVIVPTGAGPQTAAAGFFDAIEQTEHEVRVRSIVTRLEAYYAAGGTSKPTARALVQVLRKELNVKASNDVLFEASRRYTKSIGMPVDDESTNAC